MDLMTGIAWGNKFRADGAEKGLALAEQGLVAAEEGMAAAERAVANYKRRIAEKDTRIAELEQSLAIANAEAQARIAQVAALKAATQADHPLLAMTDQVYVGESKYKGRRKDKLRLIYEATFDKILKGLGIESPQNLRVN